MTLEVTVYDAVVNKIVIGKIVARSNIDENGAKETNHSDMLR